MTTTFSPFHGCHTEKHIEHSYMEWDGINCILYSGFISLGTNYPKWWTLSFSRNFPDLEIHNSSIWKTCMSDTLQSLHMHMHKRLAYGNRKRLSWVNHLASRSLKTGTMCISHWIWPPRREKWVSCCTWSWKGSDLLMKKHQ